MKLYSLLFVMLAWIAFFATSCRVGPNYHRPAEPMPQQWASDPAEDAPMPLDWYWWESFGDSQLIAYIRDAAAYNRNVKAALANICQARAARTITASAFYPDIDGEVRFNRNSFNTFFGGAGNPNPQNIASITTNTQQEIFFLGLDAIWELDLFGRTYREVEAASYRIGSSIENYRDVLVSVIAETARNYMDVRAQQELIASIKKQINVAERTLQLYEIKNTTGIISDILLAESRVTIDQLRAVLPNYIYAMHAAVYRLSVLTGRLPGDLLGEMEAPIPLPQLPEVVGVGIPSELLLRRPDIRHAEKELAAATADIGVAVSDLLPRFFLAGSVGDQKFKTPLSIMNGFVWSYTADLLTPIFKGGRLLANIRNKKAIAVQAFYTYEQTVLNAVEEAENHILGYAQELNRKTSLEKALSEKKESYELTLRLFETGITNAADLLQKEGELLQIEDTLTNSKITACDQLISLYKALGGGW